MSKGNVTVNSRTSVHAGSKGTLRTDDVCLTKIGTSTVPIIYTNIARSADAANTASTVFTCGYPACNKESIFSKSTGDEPGNKKGIRSGTIQGKAEFITASANVFFEGIPAVRQEDMMVSNNCNTAPMPLTQPGAPPARSLEARQAEELEAVEQPDRIDIGHIGEDAPLLKGRFRQSDPEESEDSTVYRRLSRYIDGDIEGKTAQRYRELVIGNVESGKPHRLSLVLNDHERNWETGKAEYIVLPLGKTESVPKESPRPEKPVEYANFAVPLVLKRYTTSDIDKSKADELRKGWIYIYLNGYLWRELMVGDGGFCQDVNLQRHQGEDVRRPSGEADSRVIVPWRINNKRFTIEIAFSEVQWSWARINALGGMNPDTDFEKRLKSDTPLSTVSESDAADSRSARMLDITGELDRWIRNDGDETENIQLVDDVTADIYTLQLNKQSKFPVVFLQDTLALLRDQAYKAHKAALKLKKLQDEDGHKRAVADIAQSIVKSYPDYDKHLRSWEDMLSFCNNYDAYFNTDLSSYNTFQDDLVSFIQDKRAVFEAIWEDYSNDKNKKNINQQDLEDVWYAFLSGISPLITSEQASGQANHAEIPDRLTKLLGTYENPTPEGKILFERALLVNDRTTAHTDNLVALLANFLAKQDSNNVTDRICERYRLSNINVTRGTKDIVVVPGDYLNKLPGHVRWGTAIDAVTGEAVTAIEGGTIVVPQLFINGKAINTLETVVEETTFEMVRETFRERTRVRMRESTFNKVHKGFRGLQILNVCVAIRDLSNQIFNKDKSIAAITAYSANLLSDAAGFAAMYEKTYISFFSRRASLAIAQEYAKMTVGFFNTASGLLLSIFESKMAFNEWQSGDTDAAFARGTMAAGSLLFSLGGLGAASEAAAAITAGSGPLAGVGFIARLAVLARFAPVLRLLGWVGVALAIGGLIYYLFADDNPVEEWLEHCVWGKHAYKGEGTVTNRQGEKEDIDYAEWKNNPDNEIAAALPLIVGYVAKTKWFDHRKELSNIDYRPHWDELKRQWQGFELEVTVPPFKNGKLIMQLSFINDRMQSSRFFKEERCAKSYQHTGPAQAADKPAGSGSVPITHSWGIGLADIPENAVQADIRLWYDSYGDGKYLLPNNGGLLLTAYKGTECHVQSI